MDILKIDPSPTAATVWVRVPRQDARAVVTALSSWIGGETDVAWRICAKGNFLGAVALGSGLDLFVPSSSS